MSSLLPSLLLAGSLPGCASARVPAVRSPSTRLREPTTQPEAITVTLEAVDGGRESQASTRSPDPAVAR